MTNYAIPTDFGAGGRNIIPKSKPPTLADALRGGAAQSLARLAADDRTHEDTVAVASNAAVLEWEAEVIEFLESAAGGVTGPLEQIASDSTLATGQFKIAADRRTLAFFGADAITSIKIGWIERVNQPARATSGNAETYALVDGQTLIVKVDGGAEQTALFETADFGDIANATAAEVAAVISTDITGATAEDIGGSVAINSDTKGGASSIEVTGGTANTALGFSTDITYGAGISLSAA